MANTPYAVILAGGKGTRLWPISRKNKGKQIKKLGPLSESLLEKALSRLDGLVPVENRVVITAADQYLDVVKKVSGKCSHVLAEPRLRGTASALCLGAMFVRSLSKSRKKQVDPVMFSLHADHVIEGRELFCKFLKNSADQAESLDKIVLLGIKPTSPSTRFGYIKAGSSLSSAGICTVDSFKEKPNLSTAKKFISSGDYLWNSGIFTWKVSTFLRELEQFLPKTYNAFAPFFLSEAGHSLVNKKPLSSQNLEQLYAKLESHTVDEAILEKTKELVVLPASFSWDDIGSWSAMSRIIPMDESQNTIFGDCTTIETSGCTLYGDQNSIATIGVKDLVVVATPDATLVCAKSQVERVKEVVEKIKSKNPNSKIL